ncbi:hypothetical protein RND71_036831 [Anisodus tanguticus]|uniref:Craniofacial development protein 2-like n=1 Tax=Anisodus tanguticus TaxID=243964 RepID=A0AAE1R4D7_9SOLA|nr:hypothetical protein RND71_036831 [Anisodus tanguticus]
MVGILVDNELRGHVVQLRRVNDRMMTIKLVVGGCTMNIIRAYTPHTGLDEEEKRHFWKDLDDLMGGIPPIEKLFIGGDFNGHIGSLFGGYGDVHGRFGLGNMNGGGVSLLEFARASGIVIANSRFLKREEHLVTFRSSVAKTQIDFLPLGRLTKVFVKTASSATVVQENVVVSATSQRNTELVFEDQNGNIRVCDLRENSCSCELTKLISGDQNGNIRVCDLRANSCSCELAPEVDITVRSLTIMWDGSLIVAANNRGTCYVWRLLSGTELVADSSIINCV